MHSSSLRLQAQAQGVAFLGPGKASEVRRSMHVNGTESNTLQGALLFDMEQMCVYEDSLGMHTKVLTLHT